MCIEYKSVDVRVNKSWSDLMMRQTGCCIHPLLYGYNEWHCRHKRSVLSISWFSMNWTKNRIGGFIVRGISCKKVITSCLNHSQSFWKPEPVFPAHSILLLLEFLSSTSSADFETKFWFAFPTNKVREPFRSFSFGSSNDSCGTPFLIPMSDTEYMFAVLVGEVLVPRPIL